MNAERYLENGEFEHKEDSFGLLKARMIGGKVQWVLDPDYFRLKDIQSLRQNTF
jgi:hypothetical protein